MVEIERKYLVDSMEFINEATSKSRIVQGFLNTDPERTVRVRIMGDQGFLTVKGLSNRSGTSRMEWETEIEVKDAERLLSLCEPSVIEKVRYLVPCQNHLFEVDIFSGENTGLIIAEIELKSENETFPQPSWLGKEVTGEIRYYNSQLSQTPFRDW